MKNIKYRVEWERHQRRLREREEAEAERERQAYAQIDWHDFVVVQTVDFPPGEQLNLPPPCTPKDVGARILQLQRVEQITSKQPAAMDIEGDEENFAMMENEPDMEEDFIEMEQPPKGPSLAPPAAAVQHPHKNPKEAPQALQPVPAAPKFDTVVVRKDYDPRGKILLFRIIGKVREVFFCLDALPTRF